MLPECALRLTNDNAIGNGQMSVKMCVCVYVCAKESRFFDTKLAASFIELLPLQPFYLPAVPNECASNGKQHLLYHIQIMIMINQTFSA